MKVLSTTAIVALMTASLGLSVMGPANAQDAAPMPPAADAAPMAPPPGGMGPGGPGMRSDGGLEALLGFERGAEAIDVAIVRLSHRLDLTDAQKGLLDTLKTSALSAAADFETATEGMRPTPPTDADATATPVMPDLPTRLENRIAMEKAHVAALESVQPAFKAFFDSLSDEQKAQLAPQRGLGMGDRGPGHRHGGPDGKGPGMGQHGKGPNGAPMTAPGGAAPDGAAPVAPDAAPAAPEATAPTTAPAVKS